MFIGIIKGRSKLYDIIVKDGKIEIIEISVDEFQRLSNKEGVFLLSFLNNIFHSLNRERGSINITLNNINLTNADFSFNFKSAYNALNGYKAPVDPLPYKGQLTGASNYNKFIF